jgi:hypothetical protein
MFENKLHTRYTRSHLKVGTFPLQRFSLVDERVELFTALLDGGNGFKRSPTVVEVRFFGPQRLPATAKLIDILLKDADAALNSGFHCVNLMGGQGNESQKMAMARYARHHWFLEKKEKERERERERERRPRALNDGEPAP